MHTHQQVHNTAVATLVQPSLLQKAQDPFEVHPVVALCVAQKHSDLQPVPFEWYCLTKVLSHLDSCVAVSLNIVELHRQEQVERGATQVRAKQATETLLCHLRVWNSALHSE